LRFDTGILLSKDLSVNCIETDDCKSWTVRTFQYCMPVRAIKEFECVYGFYQEVGVEG